MLSTVFVPTLTMAVMVPLVLCLCGPVGSWIGALLGNTLFAFGETGGMLEADAAAAAAEK